MHISTDSPKALVLGKMASGLAIAMSVFHLLTALFTQLPGLQQRVVHLTVALTLILSVESAASLLAAP